VLKLLVLWGMGLLFCLIVARLPEVLWLWNSTDDTAKRFFGRLILIESLKLWARSCAIALAVLWTVWFVSSWWL